jgi:serine/threonine protein kinase
MPGNINYDVIRTSLDKIERHIQDSNRLHLSNEAAANTKVVLNTLRFVVDKMRTLKDIDYLIYPNSKNPKNQKPEKSSDRYAPIHMENYKYKSKNPRVLYTSEEREQLLVGSLVQLFIDSFNKVNAAGPDKTKAFCERLNGFCLDARTRGAFDYALSLDRTLTFMEALEASINALEEQKKESYFQVFAAIQNEKWGRKFAKDHQNEYAQADGVFDTDKVILIKRYLEEVLVYEPGNDFLDAYQEVPENARNDFFRFFIYNEEFLKEIKINPAQQKEYDNFILNFLPLNKSIDSLAKYWQVEPEVLQGLLDKISPDKKPKPKPKVGPAIILTDEALKKINPKASRQDFHENGKLFSDTKIAEIEEALKNEDGSFRYSKFYLRTELNIDIDRGGVLRIKNDKTQEYDLYAVYKDSATNEAIKFGEGGFGKVKLIQNLRTGNFFALKVAINDTPEAMAMFQEEAGWLKENDRGHPVVLAKKGYGGVNDNKICLLEELVPGKDLYNVLDEGVLSAGERFDIALQALEQLRKMHAKGIIHRDIKAENMMYDSDSKKLAIIDFGLMTYSGLKDESLSGTQEYLAPELNIDPVYNSATDVYALGLTFKNLFGIPGIVNADDKEFHFGAVDPVARLSLSDSDYNAVAKLVDKMIDPNPNKRIKMPDVMTAMSLLKKRYEYNVNPGADPVFEQPLEAVLLPVPLSEITTNVKSMHDIDNLKKIIDFYYDNAAPVSKRKAVADMLNAQSEFRLDKYLKLDVSQLAEIFEKHKALQKISISDNGFLLDAVRELSIALRKNPSITQIEFNGHFAGVEGVVYLIEEMQERGENIPAIILPAAISLEDLEGEPTKDVLRLIELRKAYPGILFFGDDIGSRLDQIAATLDVFPVPLKIITGNIKSMDDIHNLKKIIDFYRDNASPLEKVNEIEAFLNTKPEFRIDEYLKLNVKELADIFAKHSGIQKISISNNNFALDAARDLSAAFQQNPAIEKIEIKGRFGGIEGVILLMENMLKKQGKIPEIILSGAVAREQLFDPRGKPTENGLKLSKLRSAYSEMFTLGVVADRLLDEVDSYVRQEKEAAQLNDDVRRFLRMDVGGVVESRDDLKALAQLSSYCNNKSIDVDLKEKINNKFTEIKKLTIDCPLGQRDFLADSALFQFIEAGHNHLTRFKLNSNALDSNQVAALTKVLVTSKRLQLIEINDKFGTPEDIIGFLEKINTERVSVKFQKAIVLAELVDKWGYPTPAAIKLVEFRKKYPESFDDRTNEALNLVALLQDNRDIQRLSNPGSLLKLRILSKLARSMDDDSMKVFHSAINASLEEVFALNIDYAFNLRSENESVNLIAGLLQNDKLDITSFSLGNNHLVGGSAEVLMRAIGASRHLKMVTLQGQHTSVENIINFVRRFKEKNIEFNIVNEIPRSELIDTRSGRLTDAGRELSQLLVLYPNKINLDQKTLTLIRNSQEKEAEYKAEDRQPAKRGYIVQNEIGLNRYDGQKAQKRNEIEEIDIEDEGADLDEVDEAIFSKAKKTTIADDMSYLDSQKITGVIKSVEQLERLDRLVKYIKDPSVNDKDKSIIKSSIGKVKMINITDIVMSKDECEHVARMVRDLVKNNGFMTSLVVPLNRFTPYQGRIISNAFDDEKVAKRMDYLSISGANVVGQSPAWVDSLLDLLENVEKFNVKDNKHQLTVIAALPVPPISMPTRALIDADGELTEKAETMLRLKSAYRNVITFSEKMSADLKRFEVNNKKAPEEHKEFNLQEALANRGGLKFFQKAAIMPANKMDQPKIIPVNPPNRKR